MLRVHVLFQRVQLSCECDVGMGMLLCPSQPGGGWTLQYPLRVFPSRIGVVNFLFYCWEWWKYWFFSWVLVVCCLLNSLVT